MLERRTDPPPLSSLATCARALALLLLAALAGCSSRPDEPYGLCRASAACAESSPLCVSFHNDRTNVTVALCTRECATGADCPDDGVCIETRAGRYRRLCMRRCARDSDCPFAGGFCVAVPPSDAGADAGADASDAGDASDASDAADATDAGDASDAAADVGDAGPLPMACVP